MKIIIIGGGSVGRHMAGQLTAAGHQATIIDNDASVVDRRSKDDMPGVTWVHGDGCAVDVLQRAGALDCDVFTAVTGDDEDNLVASLLAKQEFGAQRVIARVNNPRNEWLFTEMWGVDIAVSTPHLLTSLVEEAVTVGSLVRLLSLQRGKANLLEVTLAANSPACGKTLAECALPREAAVVAVIRGGHVIVPSPNTVLHENDETVVLMSGNLNDEAALQRALIG